MFTFCMLSKLTVKSITKCYIQLRYYQNIVFNFSANIYRELNKVNILYSLIRLDHHVISQIFNV